MSSPFSATSAFASIFAKHRPSPRETLTLDTNRPRAPSEQRTYHEARTPNRLRSPSHPHRPRIPSESPPDDLARPRAISEVAQLPQERLSSVLIALAQEACSAGDGFPDEEKVLEIAQVENVFQLNVKGWVPFRTFLDKVAAWVDRVKRRIAEPMKDVMDQKSALDGRIAKHTLQLQQYKQNKRDLDDQESAYLANDEFDELEALENRRILLQRDELTVELELISALFDGCAVLKSVEHCKEMCLGNEGVGLAVLRSMAIYMAHTLPQMNTHSLNIDDVREKIEEIRGDINSIDRDILETNNVPEVSDQTLLEYTELRDTAASTLNSLEEQHGSLSEEIAMLELRLSQAKIKMDKCLVAIEVSKGELAGWEEEVALERDRLGTITQSQTDRLARLTAARSEKERTLEALEEQVEEHSAQTNPWTDEALAATRWVEALDLWTDARREERTAVAKIVEDIRREVQTSSQLTQSLRLEADDTLRGLIPEISESPQEDSSSVRLLDRGYHIRSLCDILQKTREDLLPQNEIWKETIWSLDEEIHLIQAEQLPFAFSSKAQAVKSKNFKAAAVRTKDAKVLEEKLDGLIKKRDETKQYAEEFEVKLREVTTALEQLLKILKRHLKVCIHTDLKLESLLAQQANVSISIYQKIHDTAPSSIKPNLPIGDPTIFTVSPPDNESLALLKIGLCETPTQPVVEVQSTIESQDSAKVQPTVDSAEVTVLEGCADDVSATLGDDTSTHGDSEQRVW